MTGAAGFLGSHLAKHHLEKGDRVLGVDDFSSSDKGSLHLKDLCSYENFSFAQSNITDPAIASHVNGWQYHHRGLNLIYNFACPASPPRYQEQPIHTMLTCVVGTERMLRLADHYDAVLVHASTSEVYGDPDVSPQREDYKGCVNSYGPRSCYDEGKRAAEALCFDYLNQEGVDARLVRIFNTYGPNMDPFDGRVVSNFIRQALKNEQLTVYGEGRQTRSFCYVDDLIRGIVAMGALKENPRCPVNLGNPDEFTVWHLACKVINKVHNIPLDSNGINNNIQMRDLPIDDPRRRCPDISRAKTLLGWNPVVTLDQGLDKTIAYIQKVTK